MMRSLALAALLLLSSTAAWAQFSLGVVPGVQFGYLRVRQGNQQFKDDPVISPFIGVQGRYQFKPKLSVTVGVNMGSVKNRTTHTALLDKGRYKYNLTYGQLPLALQLSSHSAGSLSAYAELGLMPALLFGGHYEGDTTAGAVGIGPSTRGGLNGENFKKAYVAALVGIGFRVPLGSTAISLSGRYTPALTRLNDNKNFTPGLAPPTVQRYALNVLQIMLTVDYTFGLDDISKDKDGYYY